MAILVTGPVRVNEPPTLPSSGKMRVNPRQSRILQEKLFSLGYYWGENGAHVAHVESPFLFWGDRFINHRKQLGYTSSEEYFLKGDKRDEYKFEDLFPQCSKEEIPSIPEKWCIKPKNDTELEQIHKKVCTSGEARSIAFYYHHPAFEDIYCWASSKVEGGYKEITFEQFKKYVLNQTNTKTQQHELQTETTADRGTEVRKVLGVHRQQGRITSSGRFVGNPLGFRQPKGKIRSLLLKGSVLPL